MSASLVECVPNFSAGREPRFLEALQQAVNRVPGAVVLNASSDADHNRSVLTFAAPLERAADAALAAVRVATECIDLRTHSGVHPRIGATDVLPFIPLAGTDESDCVELAHRVGQRMASELGIPVFFYGAAALRPECRYLPDVRRGGFEGLLEKATRGESIEADRGPAAPHPSAGASAVGVRPFLVAYNINLKHAELSQARQIARQIRESSGGLPAVRALGLWLEGPGIAQVSINLCDTRATGLLEVFKRVESLAAAAGVSVLESELIGLAPSSSLDAGLAQRIKLHAFDARVHLIEERVRSMAAEIRVRSNQER